MRSTIRHELHEATPEVYWRDVFFDPAVQTRIYHELGYARVETVAQKGSLEAGLSRTFVFAQPVRAPGPLKKLFGSEQVLTERGRFDPADARYRFEVRLSGPLEKRVKITGVTRVSALSEGRIERVCELDCACAIPGLSTLTERFITASNDDIYGRRAAIEQRVLTELFAG